MLAKYVLDLSESTYINTYCVPRQIFISQFICLHVCMYIISIIIWGGMLCGNNESL